MLIGVTGKARSGKDTLAHHLVTNYGYTRTAFADRLKTDCSFIFPFRNLTDDNKEQYQVIEVYDQNVYAFLRNNNVSSEDYHALLCAFDESFAPYTLFYTDCGRSLSISPRVVWQKFGTDFVRDHIDDNFWVQRLNIENTNTVVSDVRLDNEAKYIIDNGGFIIEVVNPNNTIEGDHISERGVCNSLIEYQITNDGSLGTYYKYIDHLMMWCGWRENEKDN